MNVLHVHSGNMFGGVERMLETLAPATAGVQPIRSSFALCFEGPVSEVLRAAGGGVYPLGPVRVRRIDEVVRARRRLKRVLDSQAWDAALVHSAWSQAIFGPTILESGAPLVRWVHAPEAGPRWLEYWAGRSRPARVLCNSRYTCDAVAGTAGVGPASVVYPPAAMAPSPARARADVRAALGTPSDAVSIIIAARMESWKGHDILLDSLAMLPPGGWEAWIAGGPQRSSERRYFDSLVERVRHRGLVSQVRFLGQRIDVSRLLHAADIYCQPNRGGEPFGLSFVEALAAGLPVVTTRLGAAPEIVDDTCGVLVEPSSNPALAHTLHMLIESPHRRQEMRAGAFIRAREFCDLTRSLPHLAAELARTAPAAPSPA